MMRLARRFWTDFTEGLRAGWDVLCWGHVYPKRLDLRDIWRP